MKKQLNESPNIFRGIFESNFLVIITDQKGIITQVNHVSEKSLGYNSEELINKVSVVDLFNPINLKFKAEELSLITKKTLLPNFQLFRSISSKPLLNPSEWILKRKDSSLFPSELSILTIQDDSNALKSFMFMGTNITERKSKENSLQLSLNAAEATNLAKSQYLAYKSHDLRTPLNSIIGFSNIIMKNKPNNLNDKQLSYIHRIAKNGIQLLDIINEILNLSKIESSIIRPHLVFINLHEFIKDLLNHLEGKAIEKGIQLCAKIPHDINLFRTDPNKLRDILSNLIGNGIKYTREGKITVSIQMDSESHDATQIDVIDTGVGMSKTKIIKIFEPFYQIDTDSANEYEGYGLGLSIVRSLCSLLGYGVKVHSTLNHGSTFSIVLPSSKEKSTNGD